MDYITYPILFVVLTVLELLYFRIADRFNIIDKPNERSSHTSITLRGGGVIFVVPPLIYCILNRGEYLWFALGLLLISTISFVDDVRSLSGKIRLAVHILSVSLMFYDIGIFSTHSAIIVIAYILVIGTINAYNFMDGINGITGTYSLVFLFAVLLANQYTPFIQDEFIIYSAIGALVFLMFNFRKKAKCFAGDVGSVAMAFVVLFLLIKLILATEDYKYVLFLAVYGVDSVLTIIHRIILRQNIFMAHRLHLYQYLTNTLKWPHLAVSSLYAALQAIVSAWVVFSTSVTFTSFALMLIGLGAMYVVVKSLIIRGKITPVA
jgi:UDP-GlcNAc:undecaprenyl-phosphate/decaprenyl-phosphate GlcNAc-1-phosphate transferase